MGIEKLLSSSLYRLHEHRLGRGSAPPPTWAGTGGSLNQRWLRAGCDALDGDPESLRHLLQRDLDYGIQGEEQGSLTYAPYYLQGIAAAAHLPELRPIAQQWAERWAWLTEWHTWPTVGVGWTNMETATPGARQGHRDSVACHVCLSWLSANRRGRGPEDKPPWWTPPAYGTGRYAAGMIRDMVQAGWLRPVATVTPMWTSDLRLKWPLALMRWPGGGRASILMRGLETWDNPIAATVDLDRLGPSPPYWPTSHVRVTLRGAYHLVASCEGLISAGGRDRSLSQPWHDAIRLPGPIHEASGWLIGPDGPPRLVTGDEVAAMLGGESTTAPPTKPPAPPPAPAPPSGGSEIDKHVDVMIAHGEAFKTFDRSRWQLESALTRAQWALEAYDRGSS